MPLKHNQNNFSNLNLPKSRFAQFFDIFKIEWRTVLGSSLLNVLFCLPVILFKIANVSVSSAIISSFENQNLSQIDISKNLVPIYLVFDLFQSILYVVAFIGFSGLFGIYKNLIFGEPILFKQDFLSSLKKNWKTFSLFGFGFGILVTIKNLIGNISNISSYRWIGMLPTIYNLVFAFYLIPFLLYCLSLNSVYKVKKFESIHNASKLASYYLIYDIIFGLPFFLFQYLIYLTNNKLVYGIVLFLIAFLSGIYALVWQLYITNVFDKQINKTYYPEIYRKGLRK